MCFNGGRHARGAKSNISNPTSNNEKINAAEQFLQQHNKGKFSFPKTTPKTSNLSSTAIPSLLPTYTHLIPQNTKPLTTLSPPQQNPFHLSNHKQYPWVSPYVSTWPTYYNPYITGVTSWPFEFTTYHIPNLSSLPTTINIYTNSYNTYQTKFPHQLTPGYSKQHLLNNHPMPTHHLHSPNKHMIQVWHAWPQKACMSYQFHHPITISKHNEQVQQTSPRRKNKQSAW